MPRSRTAKLCLVAILLLFAACGLKTPPLFAVPGFRPVEDRAGWASLPRLPSRQSVVFRGKAGEAAFNIHSYLVHDADGFRMMWTSGAIHEGEAGARVMQATSADGLTWMTPTFLTPPPPAGQRFYARGFWQSQAGLLALVAQDHEGDYFAPDLQMLAFAQTKPGAPWIAKGQLANGVITNYPPRRIADGQWLEASRDSASRPGFIKGGVRQWNGWKQIKVPAPKARLEWRMWPATPAARRPAGEEWKSWIRLPLPTMVKPYLDEPIWWALPDGRLTALYRDNTGGRLYRSFGSPDGETWTRPTRTNFPDARSKIAALRLSNGLYVMVSNPRPFPRERSPLVLSVSRDGLSFVAMGTLLDQPTRRRTFGNRKTPGYQYPQLLEQDGSLFISYSRNKEDIEVLKVSVSDISALAIPNLAVK